MCNPNFNLRNADNQNVPPNHLATMKRFPLFYLLKLCTSVCTIKSPNVVWGLYVVIGNTNISFGPAQFICKAM